MPIENVLDDSEPEASAAALATALHIDAVEAFGQARNSLARDTFALILDSNVMLACTRFCRRLRVAKAHPYFAAHTAIFDRIVQKVLKDLRQLVTIPNHDERFVRFYHNASAIGLCQRRQDGGGIAQNA